MRNSFINSADLLLIIIVFVMMYSYASPHQSRAASGMTAPHTTATANARQIHQRPPAPRNAPEAVQGGGQEGLSIFGKLTVSARLIDTVLCSARSPACGTGQKLYTASTARGIDPVAPLAFFWHESGFGKAGMARVTHSLGNLRCIDGAAYVNTSGTTRLATDQSCYAAFPHWQTGAGYEAWCVLLAGPYYAGEGRTTIETIIPKYAPATDNNNVKVYISAVEYAVQLWRTGKAVLP